MQELIARVIHAWNTHDADKVAECYTPDAAYTDPFTRGKIKGRDALRSYLTKIFAAWEMRWEIREIFPHASGDGATILSEGSYKKPGDEKTYRFQKVEIAILEGDLIARNEIFFDGRLIS
jgi:uncharacterized protein (TIGR02246 family)